MHDRLANITLPKVAPPGTENIGITDNLLGVRLCHRLRRGVLGGLPPLQEQGRGAIWDESGKYPVLFGGRDERRLTRPRPLGEVNWPDPGCFLQRLPHGIVHLVDCCIDTKGKRIIPHHRLDRNSMEERDRDSKSITDGGDPFPQHPTWILHWNGHGNRLPQSQDSPAADVYEGGGPL